MTKPQRCPPPEPRALGNDMMATASPTCRFGTVDAISLCPCYFVPVAVGGYRLGKEMWKGSLHVMLALGPSDGASLRWFLFSCVLGHLLVLGPAVPPNSESYIGMS
jgi:hypothetical protein